MDTLVRLWLNACMLEQSLFVSIANIRKKTFSDSTSYPAQYDPPICPCTLHLSELTAVAEHHQYTAFYLPLCYSGVSFSGYQTLPPQPLS